MQFNKDNYTVEEVEVNGESFVYHAYRNLVYVDKPVCEEYQQMNIFVPAVYYEGKSINGYDQCSAPIFMPNLVGGYMPGKLGEPELVERNGKKKANTFLRALMHGYVVAVPAIRGRVLTAEEGSYIGKAPACIVDYKAAVRFIRFFADELPGDMSKIITNGTSAGGALSSLMGATGNHPDYEPYLKEIGAMPARDDVFAASCYCPITNLDNADIAYEWEFGELTELEPKVVDELRAAFPEYVNSLELKDDNGVKLTLNEAGEGTFKEYMEKVVLASAQRVIDKGVDISDKEWLTIEDGKAVAMSWSGYVKDITRMKNPPAFDSLSLKSFENDLFGSENVNCRHFTEYSFRNSRVNGEMAEAAVIKMLNPMNYIDDNAASKAKHYRIRHGERDRDTSLAISAILTLKLRMAGVEVNYHSPWDVPHAGGYDLDELFEWIDGIVKGIICKKTK